VWFEVAGLAGAGKSTLCRRLVATPGQIFVGGYRVRRPGAARALVRALPRLARLAAVVPERRLLLRHARELAYLEALLADLRRRLPRASAGVLDQGPVYLQAALRHRLGARLCGHPAVVGWLARAALLSSAALQAVVWLDAPDEVLLRRVRQRANGHPLERLNEDEAACFLRAYRAAYEEVLAAQGEGTAVLRIDTDGVSPQHVLGLALGGLAEMGVGASGETRGPQRVPATGCSP